jgi:Phage integrase, N-terminal SAM-like domain
MRTIREATLDTRKARLRLEPRKKPYWRTLVPRVLALGYRRRGSQTGSWVMRRYIGNQAYVVETLGTADDYRDDFMTFTQAQALALERAKVRGTESLTVADAITEYVEWLKLNRATGYSAERRAMKLIIPQLGKLKLSDLTTTQINSWRDRLAKRRP